MTSLTGSFFTTDKDTIVGSNGSDTFVVTMPDFYSNPWTHESEITNGDVLSGGAGTDTLKVVAFSSDGYSDASLDLRSFASLQGIERIVVEGSAGGYSQIQADQKSLAGVTFIDGGAAFTRLEIEGGIIDLSGKTFERISSIAFKDPSPTIIFDNLDTARAVFNMWSDFTGNTTIVLKGASFSPEDRTSLFNQAIKRVVDESGSYLRNDMVDESSGIPEDEKLVQNLDGDHIYGSPGIPIQLDADLDAIIGTGSLPNSLSVSVSDWEGTGFLSLLESVNGVSLVTEVRSEIDQVTWI